MRFVVILTYVYIGTRNDGSNVVLLLLDKGMRLELAFVYTMQHNIIIFLSAFEITEMR